MPEVKDGLLVKHASECGVECSPHTSFMFSSLNNKQKKKTNPIQLYLYFWNHSLTFHLSKYIIYIILEYIKYRIGTIPFHTSRVLLKYSNNCGKSQLVCNSNNLSFFFKDLLVCHLKT